MYLGNGPPRRRTGSNPIRVVILVLLIAVGLYIITVRPETIPQPFQPTPTPTRTATSFVEEAEEFYRQGRLDDAIELYELAIRSDPTIVENYIPLVRLLVFQSRTDEGLDYAETALFVDPNYAPAHAIRAMALDWKSSELADKGLEKEANDLLVDALGDVNRAIETDPSSAEAYAYQAEILFDLGNFPQANEAIETALQLDPESVDAQRIAGYVAEFQGYRQAAIEYYLQAIRLQPNLAMLHHALGRTYIGAGDIDLAQESLETAIVLDPENPEHLYYMGYAYFSIGERELAADYFNQVLEYDPESYKAHCQLGLIYYQNRNWEGAVPELEIGVEGYADQVTYRNAFCFYTLGLSYFYLGRCEEAYPLFDQVLESFPENAPSLEGTRLCREAEAQVPVEPGATVTP